MSTDLSQTKANKTDNVIYKMALFLYIVLSYLFNNSITYIPTLLCDEKGSYLTAGLVGISLLLFIKTLHHLYAKDLIKIILLFALGVITWSISESPFYFILTLFLLSAKDVDMDAAIKTVFIATLLCILATVYLAHTEVIENVSFDKNEMDVYSYGFHNVNGFSMAVFGVNVMFLYLRRKKLSYLSVFIFLAVGLINYNITQARTPFFATITVCVLLFPYIYAQRNTIDINEILGKSLIRGMLIIFAISTFIFFFYFESLKHSGGLLSGRVVNTYLFVNRYGISLFGTQVATRIGETLDMGYIYILLSSGFVGLTCFILAYIGAIRNAINKKDTIRVLAIFAFLITGIGETVFIRLEFNFSLLFMIPYIWGEEDVEKDMNGDQSSGKEMVDGKD